MNVVCALNNLAAAMDLQKKTIEHDKKHAYERPVGVTPGPNNTILVVDVVGNIN